MIHAALHFCMRSYAPPPHISFAISNVLILSANIVSSISQGVLDGAALDSTSLAGGPDSHRPELERVNLQNILEAGEVPHVVLSSFDILHDVEAGASDKHRTVAAASPGRQTAVESPQNEDVEETHLSLQKLGSSSFHLWKSREGGDTSPYVARVVWWCNALRPDFEGLESKQGIVAAGAEDPQDCYTRSIVEEDAEQTRTYHLSGLVLGEVLASSA